MLGVLRKLRIALLGAVDGPQLVRQDSDILHTKHPSLESALETACSQNRRPSLGTKQLLHRLSELAHVRILAQRPLHLELHCEHRQGLMAAREYAARWGSETTSTHLPLAHIKPAKKAGFWLRHIPANHRDQRLHFGHGEGRLRSQRGWATSSQDLLVTPLQKQANRTAQDQNALSERETCVRSIGIQLHKAALPGSDIASPRFLEKES